MSSHLSSGKRKLCFSGACIHQEGTGACSAKASGSQGPELDSAFIQRQSGLQIGHILVMILQEGLQLSPVVVPLFKCECSIKATGNFCEVNPKKQPLCGIYLHSCASGCTRVKYLNG